MSKVRTIAKKIRGMETADGAGVRLTRIFGFYTQNEFDPFLLLDNFGSDNPDDYIAGFPWHPHRGIETVTYMMNGLVEHGDSMGNSGTISTGDVQWMTAGSGIIHQEMPKQSEGHLSGFQLWVNLPKANKMMPPRYQDVPASTIPVVSDNPDLKVKVIAGSYNGVTGPVKDIICEPLYLDINLKAQSVFNCKVDERSTTFCYFYKGSAKFGETDEIINAGILVKTKEGDEIKITCNDEEAGFILVSGLPLNEPVAWRGPIVMNTAEELDLAFYEYRHGTFIK